MATEEKTIYIDEDVGADSKDQTGTAESPYKTLGYALFAHGESSKYLTRKSKTGDIPEGADESARLEWKAPAKAAMKKAVNLAKQMQKKAAREVELLAQRSKEDADRRKVLEEAKKIVVEYDESLPTPVRIKLDEVDPLKVKLGSGDAKGTRGEFVLSPDNYLALTVKQ